MSDNAIEREQQIRDLAYSLWNKAGRPAGKEDEFWRQAEGEYEQRSAKNVDDNLETEGKESFPASDPVNRM